LLQEHARQKSQPTALALLQRYALQMVLPFASAGSLQQSSRPHELRLKITSLNENPFCNGIQIAVATATCTAQFALSLCLHPWLHELTAELHCRNKQQLLHS
jgi:hypothetical protein